MFPPSVQCTEAANKARRLTFMIRRSFQDLSTSASIPLYGALVCPHLQYGVSGCSPNLVADINHLERIQRLATRLVTGMRHLPYEERLQRLDLHSLQRRRLRDDLITAFKIFKGLLDIDPNLFFLPLARRGLRGHPFKVLRGASHRRRRGSAFSVRVVKYWNKLPSLQLLLSMFSRNGRRKFGQKSFPPLTEHSTTHLSPTPPFPPAHHPLTVITSICYPTPCFIYVVSSGPLWPTFTFINHNHL